MKKLLNVIFFLIINFTLFSEYNFPYKNPNIATIFGSSTLLTKGIPENIPIWEYIINLPGSKNIPEEFWYNDGFKFSLVPQKKKAPLIFLLAGTGAAHNSTRNKLFQRIFYEAGYNVISISSPMHSNFILNGSKNRMPGIIYNDSMDVYNIMKETYNHVKNKIQATEFYVVGYSLGATEAGMVSYIDENEKYFNFKRIYMVNPAVDAYKSAVKLDNFLNFPPDERAEKIASLLEHILNQIVKETNPHNPAIDMDTIYRLFTQTNMTEKEMQEVIGTAFRLTAIDLNYITDTLTGRKVYHTAPATKFSPMFPAFEKVNFASFEDYVDKIAFPYYKNLYNNNLTLEQLLQKSRLQYINDYLKNSNKIAVVTNADELILDKDDLKYLKNTFGNRIIIYPYGGHCGNMFFSPNIKTMLHFLKEGELKYEE